MDALNATSIRVNQALDDAETLLDAGYCSSSAEMSIVRGMRSNAETINSARRWKSIAGKLKELA